MTEKTSTNEAREVFPLVHFTGRNFRHISSINRTLTDYRPRVVPADTPDEPVAEVIVVEETADPKVVESSVEGNASPSLTDDSANGSSTLVTISETTTPPVPLSDSSESPASPDATKDKSQTLNQKLAPKLGPGSS